MDDVDATLIRGRRTVADDDGVRAALADLSGEHAARNRRTRRQLALPALVVGGILAFGGAGAVAATQFGPWTYATEPDYAVAREWHDAAGGYLGSCESRFQTLSLEPELRAAAVAHLGSLDLESIEPDPERVAGYLSAVGRLEAAGRLVGGGYAPDPAGFTGGWELDEQRAAFFSDARVLQMALDATIFDAVARHVQGADLDPGYSLSGKGEIKCTTDPPGFTGFE